MSLEIGASRLFALRSQAQRGEPHRRALPAESVSGGERLNSGDVQRISKEFE